MMENSERLFGTIQREYQKLGKAVPLWLVYQISGMPEWETKQALLHLKSIGRIILDFQFITPVTKDDEKPFIKPDATEIRDNNVITVIRELKSAPPHRIYEEYVKRFGLVNGESFTRHVRKMYEYGILDRENEMYFLKSKDGLVDWGKWNR